MLRSICSLHVFGTYIILLSFVRIHIPREVKESSYGTVHVFRSWCSIVSSDRARIDPRNYGYERFIDSTYNLGSFRRVAGFSYTRWLFLINIQRYKSILKRNVIQHHIHLEVTNKHFIIFKCFERIGCASGLLCDIAISSLISNWRVPKTDWKGVIIDSGGYLLEPISSLINSFFSQCSRIKPYGVFPLWYKIGPIYLWNMTDNSNCYR